MAQITKTEMINLYREKKLRDPVNTGNRIYAYLHASEHKNYGDSIVWCSI